MKIAITGVNGYVGSTIASHFAQRNDEIVRLVRNPTSSPDAIKFTLGDYPPEAAFRGVDALVHCAYDFEQHTWQGTSTVNIEGSRRLFERAITTGVPRIIFISSMSAFPGCKSVYGKSKLAIEKLAMEVKAVVVRPGLVYGNKAGHLVGALERLMKKTSVLPLIGGSQSVYHCHVDDLARAVCNLVRADLPSGVVTLAHPVPTTFKGFLATLSGRKMFFLPVPHLPLLWALLLAERFHVPLKFHSDSLIGLMHTDPSPDFSRLHTIGFEPRPFC